MRTDGGIDVSEPRIGLGYDRHRRAADRPLRLGGLTLAHENGLLGHSDADALLHAVIDAVLGAAGQDDLGTLFPDTDPRYAGADSTELARVAMDLVKRAGFRVLSLDAVLVIDRPKIAPHRAALRTSLSTLFELPVDRVNVKAKTTEGSGDPELVEVTAVALLGTLAH